MIICLLVQAISSHSAAGGSGQLLRMGDDFLIDWHRLYPGGRRRGAVEDPERNALSGFCAPAKTVTGHEVKGRVKASVDLEKAAEVLNDYNESLPPRFPKLSLRPGYDSDLKVAYEVLRGDRRGCYDGGEPYGIRAGEEVLDLGANIGVSCHKFLRQGAAKVTCVEPAERGKENGIWQQLVRNCGEFEEVVLRNIGVSSVNETAPFNDHDETKAGGSRSCKATHDIYVGAMAKKLKVYDAEFESLESIMSTCEPHVIKCDVEGSDFEAFRVSGSFKFGRVRLIMLETSSARARRESNGWRNLASVIKTLVQAGFDYAKFPAALFKRKHWIRRECSRFVRNRDDIICFWRSESDEKGKALLGRTSRKRLDEWSKFRRFAEILSGQEEMAVLLSRGARS